MSAVWCYSPRLVQGIDCFVFHFRSVICMDNLLLKAVCIQQMKTGFKPELKGFFFLTTGSGRINWKCNTDIQYDCLIKVVNEEANCCLSAHPVDTAFLFVSDSHSPFSFLLRNICPFGCWMLHCVYQLVPNFVVYYLVLDRCLQHL